MLTPHTFNENVILIFCLFTRLIYLNDTLFYWLKKVVLCFLCLSPETSKNAEGIDGVLVDFRRELVLVRKYDSTTAAPRNEGFTCFGGFICFCLKKYFL